jgi:DNA-binding transcriptional ArsR family regulator
MYCPGVSVLTNGTALARFGHALSDATRARVLLTLAEGSFYPSELADLVGVSRQSLSNHLACLRGCGLVRAEAEGRRTLYMLADERIRHAVLDLLDLVLVTDPTICAESADKECC